jgi:periplasmic copper chaperone A
MHRTRRFLALLLGAALALLALAANASAHVTVSAPGATRGGGDQEITFRVPVEKTVATVGLTVALPTDTPIASVLVAPLPGWTHQQQTTELAKPITTDDGDITTAVSQITWKAQPGHGLEPGEFGAFTIIAGQLPDAPSITFRALQTYADGSVVRWNEVAAPGSKDEPENPAPVLELATDATDATDAQDTPAAGTSTALPVTLSIIALVVAVGAAALAVVSRRRGTQR